MYNRVWNQFLIEQESLAGSTIDFPEIIPVRKEPAPTRSYPSPFTTGIGAYLISKGYDLDKYLGGGKDGKVYRATDKKTGQRVAVKMVSAGFSYSGTDAEREVENYEWAKTNRESLGEDAKYLPVVYSTQMAEIPLAGQSMNGEKGTFGLIFMEELEPLPASIARSLFVPTRPRPKKDAKIKIARDKRLFREPTTIDALISLAISLTRQNTQDLINIEAETQLDKETKRRFYGNEPHTPNPHQKKYMSAQGARLMDIFVDASLDAMIENQEDEDTTRLVEEYQDTFKTDLEDAFFKAYNRPIVSGGEDLLDTSGLKGLDQFYGHEQEIEKAFPESAGVRAAMKKYLGRGLRAFDVHSDNVMMRPGTNEIVIVDLGRFDVGPASEISGQDL